MSQKDEFPYHLIYRQQQLGDTCRLAIEFVEAIFFNVKLYLQCDVLSVLPWIQVESW